MRAKGMSSQVEFLLLTTLLLLLLRGVMAAHYVVGDSEGWTLPTQPNQLNYSAWAASISFQQGDFLEFKYHNGSESLMKVIHFDYHYCDNTDPVASFHDGNTVIELSKAGSYYFISSLPHHCQAGQKLMLRVPFSFSFYSPSTSQMAMVPASSPSPEPRPQAIAGAAAPLPILLALPFVSPLTAILGLFF